MQFTPRRRRSILGLLPLFDVLQAQGHDPEALLSARNLSLDRLSRSALIDANLELDIVADALAVLSDPILGIKVGSRVSFTSYGTYAMLLMTADNLLHSAQVAVEFQNLSLLFSRMSMHVDAAGVELRYIIPEVPSSLRHFIADRDLMGSYIFMHELFEHATKALQCGVARPKPKAESWLEYQRYIDLKVAFDQPYNWFRIPSSMVRLQQKHRNQWAHKLYKGQAYELLRKFYSPGEDFVVEVRALIQAHPADLPAVAELAAAMGISERTLRRRLSQENTSYRTLIDEQLKQRAQDMLASHSASITSVAEQLGYAEPASFLRAFKRWTGMTPRQFQGLRRGPSSLLGPEANNQSS